MYASQQHYGRRSFGNCCCCIPLDIGIVVLAVFELAYSGVGFKLGSSGEGEQKGGGIVFGILMIVSCILGVCDGITKKKAHVNFFRIMYTINTVFFCIAMISFIIILAAMSGVPMEDMKGYDKTTLIVWAIVFLVVASIPRIYYNQQIHNFYHAL